VLGWKARRDDVKGGESKSEAAYSSHDGPQQAHDGSAKSALMRFLRNNARGGNGIVGLSRPRNPNMIPADDNDDGGPPRLSSIKGRGDPAAVFIVDDTVLGDGEVMRGRGGSAGRARGAPAAHHLHHHPSPSLMRKVRRAMDVAPLAAAAASVHLNEIQNQQMLAELREEAVRLRRIEDYEYVLPGSRLAKKHGAGAKIVATASVRLPDGEGNKMGVMNSKVDEGRLRLLDRRGGTSMMMANAAAARMFSSAKHDVPASEKKRRSSHLPEITKRGEGSKHESSADSGEGSASSPKSSSSSKARSRSRSNSPSSSSSSSTTTTSSSPSSSSSSHGVRFLRGSGRGKKNPASSPSSSSRSGSRSSDSSAGWAKRPPTSSSAAELERRQLYTPQPPSSSQHPYPPVSSRDERSPSPERITAQRRSRGPAPHRLLWRPSVAPAENESRPSVQKKKAGPATAAAAASVGGASGGSLSRPRRKKRRPRKAQPGEAGAGAATASSRPRKRRSRTKKRKKKKTRALAQLTAAHQPQPPPPTSPRRTDSFRSEAAKQKSLARQAEMLKPLWYYDRPQSATSASLTREQVRLQQEALVRDIRAHAAKLERDDPVFQETGILSRRYRSVIKHNEEIHKLIAAPPNRPPAPSLSNQQPTEREEYRRPNVPRPPRPARIQSAIL
jgi:hypothetical protein